MRCSLYPARVTQGLFVGGAPGIGVLLSCHTLTTCLPRRWQLMPITDKYKDMGTVVMGKVESGSLRRGSNLLMMPNRRQVEVLQLWTDEEETNQVVSGENVKIKLRGVQEEDVSSGFVLCDVDNPCSVAKVFDAQVVILETKSIISKGYSAVLHIHAAVEDVTVRMISQIDKKTGQRVPVSIVWMDGMNFYLLTCFLIYLDFSLQTRFVKQDNAALMFECQGGIVCMEKFADFPQMGRITLRDEGRTVAIGKVLKIVE